MPAARLLAIAAVALGACATVPPAPVPAVPVPDVQVPTVQTPAAPAQPAAVDAAAPPAATGVTRPSPEAPAIAAAPPAATPATPVAPATPAAVLGGIRPVATLEFGRGRVTLLLDHRLGRGSDADYRNFLWFGFAPPAVEYSMARHALADAVLRVVDPGGSSRDLPLDTPFADIQSASLADGLTALLLVTELGGFGQFTGAVGKLYVMTAAGLAPITATDALTGKDAPILLMRTVKTDWRLLPGAGGSEIHQVECRVGDATDDGYREVYASYRRQGGGWLKSEILARGWCTWHSFPPADRFRG